MNLRRVGLLSLACASGAFGFGVLANTCLDLVWPAPGHASSPVAIQAPPPAAPAEPFRLASATSAPAPADLVGTTDIRPIAVKTVPIIITESAPEPAPASAPAPTVAVTPKPRPASAPHGTDTNGAVTRPAAVSAAAKPIRAPARAEEEETLLSAAHIDRIRTALALTAEQETYWPAVATELRAISRQMPKTAMKGRPAKLNIDPDSVQRLYWAAAPLLTRLREDQKRTARELAMMIGLQEVAQAL